VKLDLAISYRCSSIWWTSSMCL